MKRKALRSLHRLLLVPFLGAGLLAWGQDTDSWPDPGLSSTRDLFPLNLTPLAYRPTGASTLGRGAVLVSLQITRGNTIEFSDPIKNILAANAGQGRITFDRAAVERFAQDHAQEPLLYYFDMEVQRTEIQFKVGLTASTDLGVTFAWQGMGGGFLDTLIENAHDLGFQQTGRTGLARNQFTLFIIQKGQVIFFSDDPIRVHPEDPVVTAVQRLYENPWLTLSAFGRLQLPMTQWYGYQSAWDSSAGLAMQWRPGRRLVLDGGAAYLRRALKPYGPDPFFIRDQVAGHVAFEWRGGRRARPYLALVATSGITAPGPETKLDRLTLTHDLGVHLRLDANKALTFSYINNISHNENTADMELAVKLTVRR